MIRARWIFVAVLALIVSATYAVCAQTTAPVPPKILTTKELVRHASDALVVVTTQDKRGRDVAQGSGFFVDRGIVATNLHVFRWAYSAKAKLLNDAVEYRVLHILGFDLARDLCVFEIEAKAGKPLPLASDLPSVGDDILVAGNPEGLEATFSKGIVSGIRHNQGRIQIQIDAAISPGSSGGPVLDMKGNVVGIATSTLLEGQRLNFAVPAILLRGVMAVESDWKLPVNEVGALSVSDRERDGLKGPVRKVVVKLANYNYDPQFDRYVRSEEVIQQATTYNPQGRVIEQEIFKNGWLDKKTEYEYRPNGLLATLVSSGSEGRKEERRFSLEQAVLNAILRVPFSTEEKSGSVGSVEGRHLTYDDRGNVTEFTQGTTVLLRRFEDRREVECAYWYMGLLKDKTRSTYEDDTFGNWVVRHETMFLPNHAQFGYQPSADEVRQIDYY